MRQDVASTIYGLRWLPHSFQPSRTPLWWDGRSLEEGSYRSAGPKRAKAIITMGLPFCLVWCQSLPVVGDKVHKIHKIPRLGQTEKAREERVKKRQ